MQHNDRDSLSRQGQRLLQFGLVLILYASFEGSYQAVLLLALGLLWPRLRLGGTTSRIAFWCLVYSTVAILAAYTIAARWGVGIETIRLAGELPHGLSHGTPLQERTIAVLAYSSAPTGLAAFVMVLYGLRFNPSDAA